MEISTDLVNENHLYKDLNLYTEADVIDFLYIHHKQDMDRNIQVKFSCNCDFNIVIIKGWIFIIVSNIHSHLRSYLKAEKYSMIYYSDNATLYAFYAERRRLEISDFKILKGMFALVRNINKIEVEPFKVTFRRFSPQSLQTLCRAILNENILMDFIPLSILQRLGFDFEVESCD